MAVKQKQASREVHEFQKRKVQAAHSSRPIRPPLIAARSRRAARLTTHATGKQPPARAADTDARAGLEPRRPPGLCQTARLPLCLRATPFLARTPGRRAAPLHTRRGEEHSAVFG